MLVLFSFSMESVVDRYFMVELPLHCSTMLSPFFEGNFVVIYSAQKHKHQASTEPHSEYDLQLIPGTCVEYARRMVRKHRTPIKSWFPSLGGYSACTQQEHFSVIDNPWQQPYSHTHTHTLTPSNRCQCAQKSFNVNRRAMLRFFIRLCTN